MLFKRPPQVEVYLNCSFFSVASFYTLKKTTHFKLATFLWLQGIKQIYISSDFKSPTFGAPHWSSIQSFLILLFKEEPNSQDQCGRTYDSWGWMEWGEKCWVCVFHNKRDPRWKKGEVLCPTLRLSSNSLLAQRIPKDEGNRCSDLSDNRLTFQRNPSLKRPCNKGKLEHKIEGGPNRGHQEGRKQEFLSIFSPSLKPRKDSGLIQALHKS